MINEVTKAIFDAMIPSDEPRRSWIGELDESSLSRIWSLTKRPFAIVTAFRARYDREVNQQRNKPMLAALNAAKLGPHLLIGHWLEAPDGYKITKDTLTFPTGETYPLSSPEAKEVLTPVVEDSFFVPIAAGMGFEEFREIMLYLVRKGSQDAAILSDGEQIGLLLPNDQWDIIGKKTTFEKLGVAYSRLRKNRATPFIFEGAAEPTNNIGRQAFQRLGLAWTRKFNG